ncbi:hypothetical protein GE21DRAFT_1179687, partial [Neurospora crassa]
IIINTNCPPLVTANTNRLHPSIIVNTNRPPLIIATRNISPLSKGSIKKFGDNKNDKAKVTAKPIIKPGGRDSESDDEPSTPRRSKKVVENLAKRIIALQKSKKRIAISP